LSSGTLNTELFGCLVDTGSLSAEFRRNLRRNMLLFFLLFSVAATLALLHFRQYWRKFGSGLLLHKPSGETAGAPSVHRAVAEGRSSDQRLAHAPERVEMRSAESCEL